MVGSILFITDSLGLPRQKPETVTYEETYIGLLKSTYPDANITQLSIGGAVLPLLYRQASGYFAAYHPDLVVVQSGIVDCAPRTLKEIELNVILSNRVLRGIWNRFFKKHSQKIRTWRKITYTSETVFSNHVIKMCDLFDGREILWIPIMPASIQYEQKVPGVTANVEKYNNILLGNLKNKLLDIKPDSSWLMSDYHHLNKKGHKEIFRAISDKLNGDK